MRAAAVGLLLSVALVWTPSGVAEDPQEIEYVSVVGGWEEGCAGDSTVDLLIHALKSIASTLGLGGFPGDAHCVTVPEGVSSIAVAAADATGDPIRVIVSQYDADGHLTGTTLCNAGVVTLLPETVDVALTLAPYSTTTTPCPGAGLPTTGSLFVSWS